MFFTILLLLVGLIVLGCGAEMLVSGSSRLAMHLGIPPLVVGLTVVAFGTSAPELSVSIMSALSGYGSLALGNVIGSNIANIGLILGVTALVSPIRIEVQLVRQEIPIMIVCCLVLAFMLLDQQLGTGEGVLLSLGLLLYIFFNYRQSRTDAVPDDVDVDLAPMMIKEKVGGLPNQIALILCGLILLIGGSRLFVDSAVDLARFLGVSEAIIGLSLIAIGTSVPELATGVLAALRNQSDIAIGNVIGSNIFNILCVLGFTSMIAVVLGNQIALSDFVVMLVFALALLPLAKSGLTLSRREGLLLLAAYAGYLSYLGWSA
ncbi:MAG: calcium/sodium antiporter [Gammaproteobacteria bacterium]